MRIEYTVDKSEHAVTATVWCSLLSRRLMKLRLGNREYFYSKIIILY